MWLAPGVGCGGVGILREADKLRNWPVSSLVKAAADVQQMTVKESVRAASKCDTGLHSSTGLYWYLAWNSRIYSTSFFTALINGVLSATVVTSLHDQSDENYL